MVEKFMIQMGKRDEWSPLEWPLIKTILTAEISMSKRKVLIKPSL